MLHWTSCVCESLVMQRRLVYVTLFDCLIICPVMPIRVPPQPYNPILHPKRFQEISDFHIDL